MSDHTTDEIGAAAALLQRASSPATADELEAADATISRFIEVVLEPSESAPTRRLRALPVSTRVAAVVVAATLWSTGIAAAATGNLPDQVQHAVSHTASHVGLSLPDPSDQKTMEATDDERSQGKHNTNQGESDSSTPSSAASTTSPTTTATSTGGSVTAGSVAAAPTAGAVTQASSASTTLADGASRGVGPDVSGPAHDGLCNAYLRGLATGHPKNPNAPPWRNLIAGATQAGKSVEAFCGSTTATTTATTVASAASTSSISSTTNTTAATMSTLQTEEKPHGGNGNGNGGAAGDGNSQGNGNGNHQGNGNGNSQSG